MESKGRTPVLLHSSMITSIFALVSAFAWRIEIFAFCVFMMNFGFIGFFNASIVFITEISSENLRQITPNLLLLAWSIGHILIAGIMSTFNHWNIVMFFFIGVPLLLTSFFHSKLSDSPRFL